MAATEHRRHSVGGVTYPRPDAAATWRGTGAWANETLGSAMRAAAARHPDRVAIVAGHERITFAELDRRSDAFAVALAERGVVAPDRVLMQVGVSVDAVVALAACFKSGLIPVCAVPRYGLREMRALAAESAACAHIVEPSAAGSLDLAGLGLQLQTELPELSTLIAFGASPPNGADSGEALLDAAATAWTSTGLRSVVDEHAPAEEDLLAFQLSGGTTAVPKIIPRFHAEYLGYARHWMRRMQLGADDVVLWPLPIAHNAGMLLALVPCLTSGATLVLMPRFSVEGFLGAIAAERATFTGSIGPIAGRLLDFERREDYDLSSLRLFVTLNGAREIEAQTGIPATNIYGITEGMVLASGPDARAAARHGTVGHAVSPGDDTRVLALDGSGEASHGEVGELCFRGPSVLTAYVGHPAATDAAFTPDGYFRTGDLVKADDVLGERCYAFAGRLKDNIDRGGEKFGVEDIEELLAAHPSIAEARVVGMPDRDLGERACAFVILRGDAPVPPVEDVGAFLLRHDVAKFKLPERIEPIDEFPITSVGKLDRPALRARIAAILEDEQRQR